MMNWRLFFVLWLGGVAAALAIVPVLVTVAQAQAPGTPMLWLGTTATILIGATVIYAGVIYLGMRMGAKLGLGAPILEAWLAGRGIEGLGRYLGSAAIFGAGIGAVGVVIAIIIAPSVEAAGGAAAEVLPLWSGLALSVFAAIDEELFFRFGLMTLIVWFVARLLPAHADGRPGALAMWVAVAISAVVFELAHVTPVSGAGEEALAATQPLQAVRLVVGGLLGWLYWTHGLESAMTAHFVYNMVFFYGVVLAV